MVDKYEQLKKAFSFSTGDEIKLLKEVILNIDQRISSIEDDLIDLQYEVRSLSVDVDNLNLGKD